MRLLAYVCAFAVAVFTLTGCNKAAPANVAAQVNSRAITFADIDKQLELQFAGAQERPTGEELTIRKLELLRTLVQYAADRLQLPIDFHQAAFLTGVGQ